MKQISAFKESLFLKKIYKKYIKNNKRAEEVLQFKINGRVKKLLGERGLPSNKKFLKNGWSKKMLLRYGLAIHYSRGKSVLETCSGLGWGAYLLDKVAKKVVCLEKDKETINFAKKTWQTEKNEYIAGSVLKMPVKAHQFDIVLAMESIEHFNKKNIIKYLGEIYRALKPSGLLIGSSFFPDTRTEAKRLSLKNQYHLYICTKGEMTMLLKKQGFKKIKIFQNRLFFVAKK